MNTNLHLKDKLRVCVMGGGNAAHALAVLLPSRGIPTNVLASHGDEAERLAKGVTEQDHIVAEFAEHNNPSGTVIGTPDRISAKAADVVPDSDVLILPLPSFAYASVLKELKSYLHKGMYIGVTPGQLSAAVGTTLIPAFINRLEKITNRKQKMKRIDHYIIIGHSSLARNTYHELHARGEEITVILPNEPTEPLFANIDVVIGDGSDVDVLKSAGGEKAKAILALLDDDSENAFVVLAAKELKGNIKTVAAVNDMKNMKHIRRVHPQLIIAPQVLGGELLSMALTGEEVDSSTIMHRLMGHAKLATKKS